MLHAYVAGQRTRETVRLLFLGKTRSHYSQTHLILFSGKKGGMRKKQEVLVR